MLAEVAVDRGADPRARVRVGEAQAAEEALLPLERQAGDRPLDGQALEQPLAAASEDVLMRRSRARREVTELAQRALRQPVAELQDAAVRIGVLADGGADLSAPPAAAPHRAQPACRMSAGGSSAEPAARSREISNQTTAPPSSTPHASASCSTRNRPQPLSASSGGATTGASKPGPPSRTSTRTSSSVSRTASMIESSGPTPACWTLLVTSSDTSRRASKARLSSTWFSRSVRASRAAVPAYGPPASSKLTSEFVPPACWSEPSIAPPRVGD